jgi:hypothetical protein
MISQRKISSVTFVLLSSIFMFLACPVANSAEPLPSWNDGPAKAAILGICFRSHVGTLDKALDRAAAEGWIIVDMKKDWKKVFFEK